MENEAIEKLTAAIQELSRKIDIQNEFTETLNARQSDLISQMGILRQVIEDSASGK